MRMIDFIEGLGGTIVCVLLCTGLGFALAEASHYLAETFCRAGACDDPAVWIAYIITGLAAWIVATILYVRKERGVWWWRE